MFCAKAIIFAGGGPSQSSSCSGCSGFSDFTVMVPWVHDGSFGLAWWENVLLFELLLLPALDDCPFIA